MTANLYNLEKLNIKNRQRKYITLDILLSFPVKNIFCLLPFPNTLYKLMIRYLIPLQKALLM